MIHVLMYLLDGTFTTAAVCSAYIAAQAARRADRSDRRAHRSAEGLQLRHSRFRVVDGGRQDDKPELHYCRHCRQLIDAAPIGTPGPWQHVQTGLTVCNPAADLLTWAEPAIPERWLRDVSAADLADADPTVIVLAERCRHCRLPIEQNPRAYGSDWIHTGGGVLCQLPDGGGANPTAIAEPALRPLSPGSPTRPPLREIPPPESCANCGRVDKPLTLTYPRPTAAEPAAELLCPACLSGTRSRA